MLKRMNGMLVSKAPISWTDIEGKPAAGYAITIRVKPEETIEEGTHLAKRESSSLVDLVVPKGSVGFQVIRAMPVKATFESNLTTAIKNPDTGRCTVRFEDIAVYSGDDFEFEEPEWDAPAVRIARTVISMD